MKDLGAIIAYTALPDGVPAYDRDGRPSGTVEHVLFDEAVDVFHGLVLDTGDDRYLFADREQIGALHERGVVLSVPRDALHDPADDEVARVASDRSGGVQEGLRRAWDWLSRPH